MTTREWAALHWLVLCCEPSFVFANPSDLPIETALVSLTTEVHTPSLEVAPVIAHHLRISEQEPTHSMLREDVQILWPMMPKETLAKLANTFYPNSAILAQRFIQKSIRLSKALGVVIDPNMPFQHAQIIAIPNEKEVRALTHRIKKLDELAPEQEQLQLSYQLKNTTQMANKSKKDSDYGVKTVLVSSPVNIKLPELHVPKITLPTIQRPNFDTLGNQLRLVWENIHRQMGYIWQSGIETLWGWNAQLVSVKTHWQTESIHDALQERTLRISVFIGTVILLCTLIWQLNKQYLRRKVALLNTLRTDVEEPELGEISAVTMADEHANDTKADALEGTQDTLNVSAVPSSVDQHSDDTEADGSIKQ